MQDVKTTFDERADEINAYYLFVKEYINSENSDSQISKILKSNLILMLYNIVESTVSNAIDAIHNNIQTNGISFNTLNFQFKKLLIDQLKKNGNSIKVATEIQDIAKGIITHGFNKKSISNGNIDNKQINALGRQYGFDSTTTYETTKNGKCLESIKRKRNDLAHGTFSFTEVGQGYSIEELEATKNQTIYYLEEIVGNINQYLENGNYKHI